MDQVSLIREKIDLVSFLSEYIKVQRAGKNFRALCPFHNEKSPSFMISPDRQVWHCFGCKKGGDIYSFLMEYERMEFPEALRTLAKRAGVELVSTQQSSNITSKKERMYQMNTLAKEFYHYVLTRLPAGKKGLDYLRERGITDKLITTFALGFSPASGNSLLQYLTKKKNYSPQELLEAGLVAQNSRGYFDFFRGRLMFPLIDHRDNVVGFSGRVLDTDAQTSKYMNTRETLVYHKGEHFYGINTTKDAIRKTNQAIIVEGEFDVISSFHNGIDNVVGVKGTALTEAQVNLLTRYAQKLTFCFDGDHAGQEAIKRSLGVVEKKDVTTTVIQIPGGKDPDESLKEEPGLFKKAVREDIPVYDYLLDQTIAAVDRNTPEGKKQIADTLLPLFGQIRNAIVKEHFLRKLSSELQTSYESIVKELDRAGKKDNFVKANVTQKAVGAKRPQEEVLEEYLLALFIQHTHPKHLVGAAMNILEKILPQETAYQKIYVHLQAFFAQQEVFESKAFALTLPSELLSRYDMAVLLPLPEFSDEKYLVAEVENVSRKLGRMYISGQMKKITDEIQQREQAGEDESVANLQRRYSVFVELLNNL